MSQKCLDKNSKKKLYRFYKYSSEMSHISCIKNFTNLFVKFFPKGIIYTFYKFSSEIIQISCFAYFTNLFDDFFSEGEAYSFYKFSTEIFHISCFTDFKNLFGQYFPFYIIIRISNFQILQTYLDII